MAHGLIKTVPRPGRAPDGLDINGQHNARGRAYGEVGHQSVTPEYAERTMTSSLGSACQRAFEIPIVRARTGCGIHEPAFHLIYQGGRYSA